MALMSQAVAVEVSEWHNATALTPPPFNFSSIIAAVAAWPHGTLILMTSRPSVLA